METPPGGSGSFGLGKPPGGGVGSLSAEELSIGSRRSNPPPGAAAPDVIGASGRSKLSDGAGFSLAKPPGGGVGTLSAEELSLGGGSEGGGGGLSLGLPPGGGESMQENLSASAASLGSGAKELDVATAALDAAVVGGLSAAAGVNASEEHSEDEADEAAIQQMQAAAAKRGNRGAVGGQKFQTDADFKPPVYEKSWEQHEQITTACSESILFGSLPPQNLKEVVDAFEGPKTVAAGTKVIIEGQNVTSEEPGLFIVESGTLSVYKAKKGIANPGVKVFAYDKIGQTFGELALLYNCPRQATVIASTECVLWSLDGNTFNHCVKGAFMSLRARYDKLLTSIDILQGLTDADRTKISDVLHLRTYAKGERIIRKGDGGDEFFMLEEGSAYASVDGSRVKDYGPMSYFGELALTMSQPRAADVFAEATPTICAVLDGESFKRLLGSLNEVLAERAKEYGAIGKPSGSTPSAAPSMVAASTPAHDASEEEEDDEMDEAEFLRQQEAMKNRSGARTGVAAERWEAKADYNPPVNKKTPAQYEQISAACSTSWIFKSLNPAQLKVVVDAWAGPTIVKKGQEVIREGQMVGSDEAALFMLESGELNVFKAAAGKAHPGNQVFTIDKVGHSFGEVALLYNCPRTATIIASKESRLWSIDRDTFNHCVKGAQAESKKQQLAFLRTVQVLKSLAEGDLEKIAEVLQQRTFQAGDQIIRKGDEGYEFFMLEQGSAYASINGNQVKQYGAGEYFGELALQSRQPRAADVYASASPTVLSVLDADYFTRLLGNLSDFEQKAASSNTAARVAPAPTPNVAMLKSAAAVAEEEEEEGSEMDEAEFLRQQAIMEKKSGARTGVTAEKSETQAGFTPPVYEKTPAQSQQIKMACLKSFVFSSLPPANLAQVIAAFKGPTQVRAGVSIIKEGERVHSGEPALFVLESGRLKVYKAKPKVKHPGELVFTLEEVGATFGEVALLYNCPRTATVVTETDSMVWSIDRDTFNNCVIEAKKQQRQQTRSFLDSVDILRSLSAECREKVAEVMKVRYYETGDTIIRQGDDGTEFFMIQEGAAYAWMDGKRVKYYGPRGFFGELALINRQTRIASVFADASPTACLILDADSFRRLLGSLTDLLRQREQEYSSQGVAEEEDEDAISVGSTIDPNEFEASVEVYRQKGRRNAILGENEEKLKEWAPPIYKKSPIQSDNIQAACMKSFMFSALPPENLKQVIGAFKGPDTYHSGTEIIKQGYTVHSGEPALFILESGKLDIFHHKEKQLPPGDLVAEFSNVGHTFGEVALLYNCPRTATVIARSESKLWSLDRDTFNALVRGTSAAARQRNDIFLSSIELFRNITKDERNKLVDVLKMRTYKRGQYIIRKGEQGNEFFLMHEGTAYALVNGQRVQEYGPNQYFGELALMYRQPRAADVIASSNPTNVAVLDAGSFKRILGNLQQLMAERAHQYSMKAIGGLSLSNAREVKEEWFCSTRNCNFRNFGRQEFCCKCGQPRGTSSVQSNALVPYSEQLAVSAQFPPQRYQLNGAALVVIYGVELASPTSPEDPSLLYATYPRRMTDVGIVQGTFPLVPGERFVVTLHCLGSFGEISVGLAPSAEAVQVPVRLGGSPTENASLLQKQIAQTKAGLAAPRGTAMVGWGTRELGITGDHGRWCYRGQLPGPQVSPPWQSGDVLECGISEGGAVYMMRNGEDLAVNGGYWPAEDAYPTVTLHSGGADVLLDLRGISRKRPRGRATHELPPAEAAKDLLNALKRTVIPGPRTHHGFGFNWFGGCCSDVQRGRPETLPPSRPSQ